MSYGIYTGMSKLSFFKQSSITDNTAFIAFVVKLNPLLMSGISKNVATLEAGIIPACANDCNSLSFSAGSLDNASAELFCITILFVSSTMSFHFIVTLEFDSGSMFSFFGNNDMHFFATSI